MTRLIPATLITTILASACAFNPADTPIIDTKVWGDPNITQGFYGKYHVRDRPSGNGLEYIEISRSQFGKPLFTFSDRNGKVLGIASPHSCSVGTTRYMVAGNLSCGIVQAGLFGKFDYPYIDLTSASFSAANPDDASVSYTGNLPKLLGKNGYVLKVIWSEYVKREDRFLLEKIE